MTNVPLDPVRYRDWNKMKKPARNGQKKNLNTKENKKKIFFHRRGDGTPFTIAIVLALLIVFSVVSEFGRLWLIAQGVEEAAQDAVICALNDNYAEVYHAVREGYAAGYYPADDGGWLETVDYGDVYSHISRTLGMSMDGTRLTRYADGQEEFSISGLNVEVRNNALASGDSEGYTAVAEIRLEAPLRFSGNLLPPVQLTLHTEAKYIPKF